jgi:hypothetical protein
MALCGYYFRPKAAEGYNVPMLASRHPPLIALVFALAAATADAGDISLNHDVLPLFKVRCVKCHGPAKREGKLNLASSRGLARGGQTGPAIDMEKPLESLLWQRIADEIGRASCRERV